MSSGADEARQLEHGAAALGVALPGNAVGRLIEYLDLLYAWNPRARLTTIARLDAVRLHLLDSLSVVPAIGSAGTLVDLGSGAGLPAIPVAVARPGLRVVMVESKRRRCSFLLEAVRELGLGDCTVLEEDARVLAASGRTFGAVVARAFQPPEELVETSAPMVAAAGVLVVMGGREKLHAPAPPAIAGAGFEIAADASLALPGGDERRQIVSLRRAA